MRKFIRLSYLFVFAFITLMIYRASAVGDLFLTFKQEPPPLSWAGWVGIGVFIITFVTLIKEWRPPDITMLLSSGFLVIIGILPPEEFLKGFSNEIIMTIALLCIIVRTMEINGLLDIFVRKILRNAKVYWSSILSMCIPCSFVSAFANNTPIVLLMTPIIRRWALKYGEAPSKYLLPLSYSTILGGLCTVIGTSTNLVVAGLLRKSYEASSLGFFELSWVGIPCCIVGILYLLCIKPFLPDRKDTTTAVTEETSEFTAEFIVKEDSPLVNKRIRELSRYFRHEELIQVQRNGITVDSPAKGFMILAEDHLVFTGDINKIGELHLTPGLQSVADPQFNIDVSSSHFSEVVISTSSLLVGKTLKQANFRVNYGASVLAVYRQGTRVKGSVGDIILYAGDTLILISGEEWHGGDYYTKDFYSIRLNEKLTIYNPIKATFVLIVTAMMITAATMGVSILLAVMAAAFVFVASRSITIREAQNSIVWNLLILIASSLAFGRAMEITGLVDQFSHLMLKIVGNEPYMLIGGILFIAIVATEFLSNNAAAVILFPIAMQLATLAGYDSDSALKGVAVAVAIGCSCGFALPTGYQTHMIVYGPGGYKFSDFIKVGVPLDILILITATTLIYNFWPLR